MHTGGGLLRDPLHRGGNLRPLCRVGLDGLGEQGKDALELRVGGRVGVRKRPIGSKLLLELLAFVDEHRRVSSVVHDEVGAAPVRPGERFLGAVPVLLQRFALPGEHGGRPGLRDRRRGVVLRGENVAGAPAHVGAQLRQRLDQHRGLHRHVQGTSDLHPLERLRLTILLAAVDQTRHLMLGKVEFLAAEFGQGHVADLRVSHFRKFSTTTITFRM
mmetsp:Transcript_18936/g.47287  ORF Transcript_18936/g.47287 Transcript_18936/m.47287 type:complete len:216 (+) Transcript_18936:1766-2413(+)